MKTTTVHFPPKPQPPEFPGDTGALSPPAEAPMLDRLETFFKLGEELNHCQAIYRSIGPRGDPSAAAVILARAARRLAQTAEDFRAFNEADELFKR